MTDRFEELKAREHALCTELRELHDEGRLDNRTHQQKVDQRRQTILDIEARIALVRQEKNEELEKTRQLNLDILGLVEEELPRLLALGLTATPSGQVLADLVNRRREVRAQRLQKLLSE